MCAKLKQLNLALTIIIFVAPVGSLIVESMLVSTKKVITLGLYKIPVSTRKEDVISILSFLCKITTLGCALYLGRLDQRIGRR